MAFRETDRKNLYLDRKGHAGEWEPDRLDHLGNFLVKMGLLSEITSLPDELFSGLNQAIATSGFWNYDNSPDDTEMNSLGKGVWAEQTDAAAALGDALQDFFDAQSFPITIAVNTLDPASQKPDAKVKFPVGKGHKLYPNGIVVGAEQDIKGSRFVMYVHMTPVDDTFEPSDVNPSAISSKISRMIRHEIVHTKQYEKRRKNQKTSRQAAKKSYEREGEIPPDDAPRTQYLGAGIEIDAYAHEFAEELLDVLGKQKALEVISKRFSANDLESLGISDTLIEYLDEHGSAAFTKKLRNKIYTQIMDMTDRGLYEGKHQTTVIKVNDLDVVVEIADCEESRRKGLMNRLALDENSGMLFIFSDEKPRSFWMKETYLPLSIAYLNDSGSIINIEKMTPLDLMGTKSLAPARFALEMNEGWFERNGVCIGDNIMLSYTRNKNLEENILRIWVRSLIKETFVSHSDEPKVGDTIINNNPGCKHYGSEGIVLDIRALAGDAGKVVKYMVSNIGPAFNPGDVLEKTMDQLDRQLDERQ